jgi:hypothetical protein
MAKATPQKKTSSNDSGLDSIGTVARRASASGNAIFSLSANPKQPQIRSSPVNNANDAWIQHFFHHLLPVGVAGLVMSN